MSSDLCVALQKLIYRECQRIPQTTVAVPVVNHRMNLTVKLVVVLQLKLPLQILTVLSMNSNILHKRP